MFVWGGLAFAIPVVYFAIYLWPILMGRKPVVLMCRKCDSGGRLTETGAKEKVWVGHRREYKCEHCGHKKWVTDLSRCLFGQLNIELCPKCKKAALRYTGARKRRLFYQWTEYECIHCGHTEWCKERYCEGGGGG